jgi:hypothetical protein
MIILSDMDRNVISGGFTVGNSPSHIVAAGALVYLPNCAYEESQWIQKTNRIYFSHSR